MQLHNIPFGIMNKFYNNRIRKSIGEIINYDLDKDGVGWGGVPSYGLKSNWILLTHQRMFASKLGKTTLDIFHIREIAKLLF